MVVVKFTKTHEKLSEERERWGGGRVMVLDGKLWRGRLKWRVVVLTLSRMQIQRCDYRQLATFG
jgi:hypothetical protein